MKLKDRASICELLPHDGDMCLLSELVELTPESIVCKSRTHLDTDNPLRINGKLPAMAGIEYASQVVALHGQIEIMHKNSTPIIGFLTTVRDVDVNVAYLDEENHDLYIHAKQTMRIAGAVTYDFNVRVQDQDLLKGRMTTKLMKEVPLR